MTGATIDNTIALMTDGMTVQVIEGMIVVMSIEMVSV
jgi:hypothetical protein